MQLGNSVFYSQEPSSILKNLAYIFLNKHLTNQRQYQDFCHEIASVLVTYWTSRAYVSLLCEYQENKANNFMYHACIPLNWNRK
uniref:ImmA/IrrE family metallo-endopeptidase n=1 Tax=Lysinibacillus sp. FSL L8-0126 TaxID=2921515 RepID=UPI00406C848E